jgi:beta-phosphoglucomutase-like phosphatase (HAD superfamily)
MTSPVTYTETPPPSFLFDLDGTLIDSVYQHVIAWRAALADLGIDLSVWRIHRRIGMSGGLFVSALLRETGLSMTREEIERLQRAHADEYRAQMDSVLPLPGAAELLGYLTDQRERGHRPARAEAAGAAGVHPDGHPRPSAPRQAGPGPVPGCGGAARGGATARHGGR